MGLLDIKLKATNTEDKPSLKLTLNKFKPKEEIKDETDQLIEEIKNEKVESTENNVELEKTSESNKEDLKLTELDNLEVVESTLEAPVKEENKKEDEVIAEPEKDKQEASEEPQEEKPKKRATRKKSTKETKSKATNSEVVQDVEETIKDILGKKIDYEEVADQIFAFFNDEEWEERSKYFTEKLAEIRIEPDMNPGSLRYIATELNILNDEVYPEYNRYKELLDAFTDKEFGLASIYKKVNAVGNNESERKRAGALALVNGEFQGDKVNYVKVICCTRIRFQFFASIINRIEYKTRLCNTLLGTLKIDAQLTV